MSYHTRQQFKALAIAIAVMLAIVAVGHVLVRLTSIAADATVAAEQRQD